MQVQCLIVNYFYNNADDVRAFVNYIYKKNQNLKIKNNKNN